MNAAQPWSRCRTGRSSAAIASRTASPSPGGGGGPHVASAGLHPLAAQQHRVALDAGERVPANLVAGRVDELGDPGGTVAEVELLADEDVPPSTGVLFAVTIRPDGGLNTLGRSSNGM